MKASLLLSAGLTMAFLPPVLAQKTDPVRPAGPKAPAAEGAGDASAESKLELGAAGLDKPDPGVVPVPDAQKLNLPGLEKLTPEQRAEVVRELSEVSNYVRGVRWQEALEKLTLVEKITGDSHFVENLRGAVYTRMRDFKSAREHFQKAATLSAGGGTEAFHPRFNLAEIDFVEKKWEDAIVSFSKLLEDKTRPDKSSDALMKFKIMVCEYQLKRAEKAQAIAKTFDQYDDATPAYYYAEAVRCFADDKKEEATEWLESARRIYPPEVTEVFNDSLVEVGWLESLSTQ
jgi:tetratricopeptide (TPR) repeat protein